MTKKLLLAFVLPVLFGALGIFAQTPDYSQFEKLLSERVDKNGLVDYAGIHNTPENLNIFIDYIAHFDSALYSSFSREEQIAFWINVYNALVIKTVVDNYPIKSVWYKRLFLPKNSIRMIKGVFEEKYFRVMGREVNLTTISKHILEGRFAEPRVYFALVCGAKGCPPLRQEPYTGDRLSSQLEDQAFHFLNNPDNFKVDRQAKIVTVSGLLEQKAPAFIPNYLDGGPVKKFEPEKNALMNLVSQYVGHRDGLFIHSEDYEIKYTSFDWSLNGQ